MRRMCAGERATRQNLRVTTGRADPTRTGPARTLRRPLHRVPPRRAAPTLRAAEGRDLLDFFFQAEDGIRDGHVTGVQTCALPIYELLYRIDQEFMLARSHRAGIPLERYLQQRGAGTRKPEDENGGRHRSRLAPGGRLCAPLLGIHALELLRERQGVLERTLAARIALGVVLPQRLIAARV